MRVGAPWIDTKGGAIDGEHDDGELTGQGVRVYVVDDGVQGSHVDFGGRVVNGHAVKAAPVAAYTRPLPVPHQPTSYNPTRIYTPRHPTTDDYSLPSLSLRPCPRRPTSARSAPRAKLSMASSPPTALGAAGTAPTWPRSSAA